MRILRMTLILLLFALLGCGKYMIEDWHVYTTKGYTPPGSIDAEMQGYINQYNAEAKSRKATLGYSDLVAINWEDNVVEDGKTLWGYCQIFSQPEGPSKSEIVLSNHLNTDVPAVIKKVIIYHELSHCLLGVDHVQAIPDNVLQIMYPSSGYEQENNQFNYEDPIVWGQYLDFLFKHKELETFP